MQELSLRPITVNRFLRHPYESRYLYVLFAIYGVCYAVCVDAIMFAIMRREDDGGG